MSLQKACPEEGKKEQVRGQKSDLLTTEAEGKPYLPSLGSYHLLYFGHLSVNAAKGIFIFWGYNSMELTNSMNSPLSQAICG